MFGKKKKNETTEKAFVKVLGSGCRNCNLLEANVKQALVESGLDSAIEHVTEIDRIVAYGVMQTPSLVFGDEVVSVGRVLSVDEVKELVSKYRRMFE